jgi:starch synthase
VLTIHNIGYQGVMPARAAADLGSWAAPRRGWTPPIWHARVINPLKTGIKFADAVTTVSPTYAREICDGAARHGHAGDAAGARADPWSAS